MEGSVLQAPESCKQVQVLNAITHLIFPHLARPSPILQRKVTPITQGHMAGGCLDQTVNLHCSVSLGRARQRHLMKSGGRQGKALREMMNNRESHAAAVRWKGKATNPPRNCIHVTSGQRTDSRPAQGYQSASQLAKAWQDVSPHLWPNKSEGITEQMAETIFEHREDPPFLHHLQSVSLQAHSGFTLILRPLTDQVYTSQDPKGRKIPPIHGLLPSPSRSKDSQSNPIIPKVFAKKKTWLRRSRARYPWILQDIKRQKDWKEYSLHTHWQRTPRLNEWKV